ncbi:MAG: dihydrofolate reductase, partial [Xanthobacteraceae bacterium]
GLPGVPARTPQAVLSAHGLKATETTVLDPEHQVTVTAWRRTAAS